MFISEAFAQGAGGAAGGAGGMLFQLLPILLMFAIFYFVVFRPQQQRVKEHKELINNVRRGDTIVTAGGIIGKVTKVVDDHEVLVEIADSTRVRILKATISTVRAKTEPVKSAKTKS